MPYCAVVGCQSGSSRKWGKLQYQQFSLPKSSKLKEKWLEKINRDFIPTDHTRICAKHFQNCDFVPKEINLDAKKKPKKKLTLKPFAIPSLFLKPPENYSARNTKQSKIMKNGIEQKIDTIASTYDLVNSELPLVPNLTLQGGYKIMAPL